MMSKVEAAFQILKKYNKAMTYKEIIEIALNSKMISTKGKTPDATLRVDILKENQRRTNSGRELRFDISTPGYVSLI